MALSRRHYQECGARPIPSIVLLFNTFILPWDLHSDACVRSWKAVPPPPSCLHVETSLYGLSASLKTSLPAPSSRRVQPTQDAQQTVSRTICTKISERMTAIVRSRGRGPAPILESTTHFTVTAAAAESRATLMSFGWSNRWRKSADWRQMSLIHLTQVCYGEATLRSIARHLNICGTRPRLWASTSQMRFLPHQLIVGEDLHLDLVFYFRWTRWYNCGSHSRSRYRCLSHSVSYRSRRYLV